MTADDKKNIYNLLKTASDWTYGYKSPLFDEEMPDFFDDLSTLDSTETASPLLSQDDSGPSQAQANVKTEEAEIAEPRLEQTPTEATAKKQGVTLETVKNRVTGCQNCILSKSRKNTVTGEGAEKPLVLVIGEGPGEAEDATGQTVTGKAGDLLEKMLLSISLDKTSNCYITDIVKCRPPMNRSPMPDEISACKGYLEAQIHILKPKMILCMGRTAIQGLLNTEKGLGQIHGQLFQFAGIPVLGTYSARSLLQDESFKRTAWNDLKIFREHLRNIAPEYEQEYRQLKLREIQSGLRNS